MISSFNQAVAWSTVSNDPIAIECDGEKLCVFGGCFLPLANVPTIVFNYVTPSITDVLSDDYMRIQEKFGDMSRFTYNRLTAIEPKSKILELLKPSNLIHVTRED